MEVKTNMEFFVSKKGAIHLLPVTILDNIGCIFAIVVLQTDNQSITKYMLVAAIVFMLVLNILLFELYKTCLSIVTFEENLVKCSFLGKVRQRILYDEIEEYGITWERSVEYIYISKIELTMEQRNQKVFELYKKTSNIIVFQYNNKATIFLQNKIPALSLQEYHN